MCIYADVDIRHWWRGTVDDQGSMILSSRRLLNLIRGLPSGSMFKTVAEPPLGRGGEFDLPEKVAVATHAAIAEYIAAKSGGGKYSTFISAKQQREYAETTAESQSSAESIRKSIRSRMRVVGTQ